MQATAGKFGTKITQTYWMQGAYDVVAVIKAPDDESATTFELAVGMTAKIRTQTLRAASQDKVNGILAKLTT